MKTIIIYASKTGTTSKCAQMLKDACQDAELISINELGDRNITDYDQIVLGSYIRIGMIDKKIKNFIMQNKELLREKRTFLFLCCGFDENASQYFKENIPSDLLEKLVLYDVFGGELDLSKQKGFSKLIVKMVSKSNPEKKVKLLDERIKKFADDMNA